VGKTDLDPATSPIVFQIYNQVTPAWETINEAPISFSAPYAPFAGGTTYYGSPGVDTNFELNYMVTDLTNYKKNGVVSFRIYQLDV
jgi:hypothetical protein